MATNLLSDRFRNTSTYPYSSPGSTPSTPAGSSELTSELTTFVTPGVPYGARAVTRITSPLGGPTAVSNWITPSSTTPLIPIIDLVSNYSGPATAGQLISIGYGISGTSGQTSSSALYYPGSSLSDQYVANGSTVTFRGLRVNTNGTHTFNDSLVVPSGYFQATSNTLITTGAIYGRSYQAPASSSAVFESVVGTPSTTPGTHYFHGFRYAGTIVGSISSAGSTTAYNTSSDYRLKNEITPMEGGLSLIDSLQPRVWKWKGTDEPGVGFVAHELEETVGPSISKAYGLVSGDKDAVTKYGVLIDAEGNTQKHINPMTGEEEDRKVVEPDEEQMAELSEQGLTWQEVEEKPEYQSVDVSFLVAPLVAAVKELKSIVDGHEARIAALES